MLRAERCRRADLLVAALIAVIVLTGAIVIAATSPAAHTTSVPAAAPFPVQPAAPSEVPTTLTEVWRQPSSATTTPVVAGPVVVTGDGSTVTGRDPITGTRRWLYRRDLPLCTVGAGWNFAIAVFRDGNYCSEVSALHADTGVRGPLRNSDVPPGTQLLWDGDRMTATGRRHLETWRSDLVKTLEYGQLRSPTEPNLQPRPQCAHTSVAVTSGLVGITERCPHEPGDRLTVLRPDNADSDSPDEVFSTILPTTGATLIALTSDREAVLLPGPPRISVRDSNGSEIANYPLNLPAPGATNSAITHRTLTGHAAPPDNAVPAAAAEAPLTTHIPGAVLWWTGTSTVALDIDDLHPIWTLPGTLGSGTLFADQLLIPAGGAELLVNVVSGTVLRTIAVNRGDYRGSVSTSAIGPILLEQRGTAIAALR